MRGRLWLGLALVSTLGLSMVSCSRQQPARTAAADTIGITPDTQTAATGGTAAPSPDSAPSDAARPPASPAPARSQTSSTPARATLAPRQADVASEAPRDSAPAKAQAASQRPPADTTKPRSGSEWLKWDSATRTVTFQLIAGGEGAKSPFNFNGYTDGEATLTVPSGVTVVINFLQKDGTPHSAELIADQDPMPNMAGSPAIPRAYTNKAAAGLPQEAKDVMRFTAPDAGSFRIFCGVPGHGLSGMWIRFKVDPTAKEPTFGPT